MSVKQTEKKKRRQARKAKVSKSFSPAPNQSIIDGVKPRLIEYIQSEKKYLDVFKSIERGQVYLISTDGPHTRHLLISEQEYLGLMPKADRAKFSERFALLSIEKVVAYTEDDMGFMTYFFIDNEIL